MTNPIITVRSKEENRVEVRVEMKNTMGQDEVYSVISFLWNGEWLKNVAVQKDRKNGTKFFSDLCPKKHRQQFNRVLEISGL